MHRDYLFQMAAHRRVLRASLMPFWPGSPQHIPLKSLVRVTLENPKAMGRGVSEARWTEAREVRAGGIVFRAAAWGLSRCSEKGGEGRLLCLPQPGLCSAGKDLSWMSGLWALGYGGSQG